MKQVLRKDEVANELQVSQRQIERLIEWGEIRAFRIGKREIRITRDSLDAFKERQILKFVYSKEQ